MTDPLQKQYPSVQREAPVTIGDEPVALSGGAAGDAKVEAEADASPLRRVLHSYFSERQEQGRI